MHRMSHWAAGVRFVLKPLDGRPQRHVDFLCRIMTWAPAAIGRIAFRAKYHVGTARPDVSQRFYLQGGAGEAFLSAGAVGRND